MTWMKLYNFAWLHMQGSMDMQKTQHLVHKKEKTMYSNQKFK